MAHGPPEDIAPALDQPAPRVGWWEPGGALRRSPWGVAGLVVLGLLLAVCVGAVPVALMPVAEPGTAHMGAQGLARPTSPRYDVTNRLALRLPPFWAWWEWSAADRVEARAALLSDAARRAEADRRGVSLEGLDAAGFTPGEGLDGSAARYWLGTDTLGRSVLWRLLFGGAISLGIGLAAAGISVVVGTLYGAVAGYAGGRVDGVMMRAVDVLYGLPYVLLVVLLAVASEGLVDRLIAAGAGRGAVGGGSAGGGGLIGWLGGVAGAYRSAIEVGTLLVAIGAVSWLTLSRVIRGQVLSLKSQPFVEAARAMGAGPVRIFGRHLGPNLVGPVVVYATLTVPQAILQESFLSFLGIGVQPPLPSWGNMASDGLTELNTVRSNWWLLVFPCVMLGVTLLSLNFVGEAVREALDPKRSAAR